MTRSRVVLSNSSADTKGSMFLKAIWSAARCSAFLKHSSARSGSGYRKLFEGSASASQNFGSRRFLSSTPNASANAGSAAAGAGSKAVKQAKPFYKRFFFRATLFVAGGAIAYSLIDRYYFHPHIETEVISQVSVRCDRRLSMNSLRTRE